jgi:hypothetical protein
MQPWRRRWVNPLGVKGAGQAGFMAAPQTIINAILAMRWRLSASRISICRLPPSGSGARSVERAGADQERQPETMRLSGFAQPQTLRTPSRVNPDALVRAPAERLANGVAFELARLIVGALQCGKLALAAKPGVRNRSLQHPDRLAVDRSRRCGATPRPRRWRGCCGRALISAEAATALPDYLTGRLGANLDGMLEEYAVLSEEALVHVPNDLSFEEAATLPCAAVTTWVALTFDPAKSQVRSGLFAGGRRIRTCMGLFLSSGCFGLC